MLVLHFIKENGHPVGVRVLNDSKKVYEDYLENHSRFKEPWTRLLRKTINYCKRVYPKMVLGLPNKVSEYLLSLDFDRVLSPDELGKERKASLFFVPMILSKEEVSPGVKVTDGDKTYWITFEEW